MSHNYRLNFDSPTERGYRLHKLEVHNWGAFDGQVFSVRPEGKSTLLIGQNGSGKSTLVDALLTLLVRPGVRNFNVAAGAKKKERDEKSYLRGAYDRGSDDSGQGIEVKYLRPEGKHYTVILAWFRNDDIDKSFTLAQLLYLASDHSVEKIYCLAEGERSIAGDFSDLGASDTFLKKLRTQGWRATRTFTEFEAWFLRQTHARPKAMEVFNQTVAVKDIQKLNEFIREHMLEAKDWNAKVEELLAHFTELSEAHASLVRARDQQKLLVPVAEYGAEYRQQAEELKRAEGMLAAIDLYFAQQTIALFTPVLETWKSELARTQAHKEELGRQQTATSEQIRQLRNEIDHAGGARLQAIPVLIEAQRAHADTKRKVAQRFADALATLNVKEAVDTEAKFAKVQERLPALSDKLTSALGEHKAKSDLAVIARAELRKELTATQAELDSLLQRRENIPQWCVALRAALCAELGLQEKQLPFAAELMKVTPAERDWEASIEKVLRSFALSLLAPDRYYSVISGYLEKTKLTHDGRGQRLVYLRVQDSAATGGHAKPRANSLLRKLELRPNHPLTPWVEAELTHRFDYECCETAEEFRRHTGLALTMNRHVRSGRTHHDKDDRDAVLDPRNFVLGWDNREKRQRLAAEVQRLTEELQLAERTVAELEQHAALLARKGAAVTEALRITRFAELDFASHDREIAQLEQERRAIENKSSAIKVLKTRLSDAEAEQASLKTRYDAAFRREVELGGEIDRHQKMLARFAVELKAAAKEGVFEERTAWFAELDAEFVKSPLKVENVMTRRDPFRNAHSYQTEKLRKKLNPLYERLIDAMNRYLRQFSESAAELRANTDYLDSFLALKEQIEQDDLPRHEQRFKERLNQKVIEEIGLFRTALEQERREIEEKIELLNGSLKKVKYRGEMYVQLEPRVLRDPEIGEFKDHLRECIEGSFEDSAEANEARFLRIKKLVDKFRDEALRRWRDKVTDVRRWFDFVAAVIDPATQKTESVYQDSSGQSGGEKAKLAFTILVAAIAYQYDLDPEHPVSDRFHFVVVDEMFSKVDDQHAEYALELFKQFGLQLLIVAPLDSKARVTQPYVGSYLHVVKQGHRSTIFEMTATEFDATMLEPNDLRVPDELAEA